MIYVFLSVCCSVIVSVLLKMARRYRIDVFQAITWNYSIAFVLLFFKPQVGNLQHAPIVSFGLLAVLLPALFVIIGKSVRTAGIVRTDVAQRLSLIISLTAAFELFNEVPSPLKFVGLGIGLLAIICAIPWQKQVHDDGAIGGSWVYLLTVFVGMGVIDVLFKEVALYKDVPYTTSLFIVYGLAFILSLAVLIGLVIAKKIKFTWRHIFFGWILGVANFGNILFYLKAHQALAGKPSTVFSAMNIGVVALGAIVGLVIFKEKLSTLNKVGIVLAIVAIVIIAYTQVK